MGSSHIMSVGACCFGVVVGYITYRTLIRTHRTAVTDIVTVIGGAAVTGLFDPNQSDAFGWYSIGLLAGMAAFFLLFWAMNDRKELASVMGARDIGQAGPADTQAPRPRR
ncbi:conserved membrane hypothetical protein [Frankia sp. Hr75.2]|nr:conserved membrane hypothetical protein [Frankia sp. Hr75.2]